MGDEGLEAYISKVLRHLICFKYSLGFGLERLSHEHISGVGIMRSKAAVYGCISALMYFDFLFVQIFLQDLCHTILAKTFKRMSKEWGLGCTGCLQQNRH